MELDYGLSQNLNISRKRAKGIYRPLLGRVPRGKRLYGICGKEAREKDYVEPLFHRRRYLPDIHSSNFNLRSFAERTAMNSQSKEVPLIF